MTRRDVAMLGMVLVGFAAVLSGCPKKIDTASQSAGLAEEKVVSPPTQNVPLAGGAQPKVEEMPMTKTPESFGSGGGSEGGMSAAGAEVPGMTDIFFDFDKAELRADAQEAVEADAKFLVANPKIKVKIEGHCDERGTNEYNLALSERRAQSVKRHLTALGVDAKRISTISYGEERPFCTDKAEDCFAQNRRAHFIKR